jgi:hypothetical protein
LAARFPIFLLNSQNYNIPFDFAFDQRNAQSDDQQPGKDVNEVENEIGRIHFTCLAIANGEIFGFEISKRYTGLRQMQIRARLPKKLQALSSPRVSAW